MKFIDLTGKTFGFLTVLNKSTQTLSPIKWDCLCKCGTQCVVDGSKLRNAHTQSCGCLQKDSAKARKIDLLGRRFRRLIVVKEVGPDKWGSLQWLCKCDCGVIKIVNGSHLRGGKILSCGCLLSELMKARSGVNSPSYNPSLTNEDRYKDRRFPGYEEWNAKTKEVKKYTCEICFTKGGRLNSHHLFGYRDYPSLRLELWNCAVLCEVCHKKFHKKYGKRLNTLLQFAEFYKIMTGEDYKGLQGDV